MGYPIFVTKFKEVRVLKFLKVFTPDSYSPFKMVIIFKYHFEKYDFKRIKSI